MLLYLFIVLPGLAVCQQWTLDELNIFAKTLDVRWLVKDNIEFDNKYFAVVTLTNNGNQTLSKDGGWKIYLNCIRMIEPDVLPNPEGVVLKGQGVKVIHYQGSLFSIEPSEDFIALPPTTSRKIKFHVKYWQVARTSVMGNWYLSVPGLEQRLIESTVGEELSFVESFTKPQQVKRYANDRYSPFTAQGRYRRNYLADTLDDGEVRVVPKPLLMTVNTTSNVRVSDQTWKIYASDNLSSEALYLREKTGIQLGGPEVGSDVIRLRMGNVVVGEGGIPSHDDNYRLSVDTVGGVIDITGQGRSGVFYGVQTAVSLLSQRGGIMYELDIVDSPRYSYRGLHLDVGRNFHSKEDVIRLLDKMASYKLNKLHFHLSEDEGWRLEIPGLDELTTVGSKRCHDLNESTCLYPQLGSGPTQLTSGSGFYSVTDYRKILEEANRLHIQVIPEFDMPGHARAAIKAMEERYRRLQATGQEAEGLKYRLVEEGDTSSYITPQMFTDNAMNPCMESTYTFIEHVIGEVVKLHEGVQPLRVYHYGGDEVGAGAWVNSSLCQTLFNKTVVSTSRVKEYFHIRVSNITAQRNLNVAAWEDGLVREGNDVFDRDLAPNDEVVAYSWDNVWEAGAAGRTYDMANKDYKVVMAHATHLYFDHPYEPDPEERGYYWATRYTDTQKTFGFTPENLYSLIDVRRSGETITKEEVCGENFENCPPLNKPENIKGIQGCLWSETTRTRYQMDSQLFPRLLSLAERAWHKASWEEISHTEAGRAEQKTDWESFAKHIGRYELRRLETDGVTYRIPPPGAIIENGFLKSTSIYPGLKADYSKDGGKTWFEANNNVLVSPQQQILLRTRSYNSTRFSRMISMKGTEPLPLTDQSLLDYMAENLTVTYQVLDNFQDGTATFLAEISLKNTGPRDIEAGNWGIYYCSIYMIPKDQSHLLLEHVTITHVKGCLFKLEPTSQFKTIRAQGERKIKLQIKNWSVSKSDNMPNWYVWSEGMKPRTLVSTLGPGLDFVGDYSTVDQWKRYNTTDLQDRYDPYTPARRYSMSEDIKDLKTSQHPIIPTPVVMVTDEDMEPLDMRSIDVIVTDPRFEAEAQYLKDKLSKGGYPSLNLTLGAPPSRKFIRLLYRDPQVIINGAISASPEAYSLTIDPITSSINIWSLTSRGIFYGAQSLLSLVLKFHSDGMIPKITVEDAPRFEYRGMHLDVGRNFQSKESVMKLLDSMATYKLNTLHFHLTEDEGWRVEIEGLEELTQIGGHRCHDLEEEKCVISQLGSGPDTDNSGSGFYTVDEYKEILRYAAERHIKVIPEVDSPGHAHAAIFAMKARRQRLLDVGDVSEADSYRLHDIDDKSEYLSVQMFTDNAINPCINSTYNFFTHIVQRFIEMHRDFNPLTTFHFGGDEVATGAWKTSPACQQLLNVNVSLKEHFTQSIANITSERGLDLGGWEDGLMESVTEPFNRALLRNSDVTAYAWDNVWEWGVSTRAYALANAGYKVVLSHATHLYFDHPYEPDPEERGFYWATRFADTYKTYGYLPDSVYDNVDVRRSGDPMTKEELCGEDGSKCTPLERPENIIGIQGHLWTETVRTPEHMSYMIFPRLLALAERAWHKASWEESLDMEEKRNDWIKFANSLGYQELPALDRMNITYRVPIPGAKLVNDKLRIISPIPGLDIEISTDGGSTWRKAGAEITAPSGRTVMLAIKSADGRRRGRAVEMRIPGGTSVTQPSCCSRFYLSFYCSLIYLALKFYNHVS